MAIQIQECILAILDATVDQNQGLIHHEVLEVDNNGHTPDSESFKSQKQHIIEIVIKNDLQVWNALYYFPGNNICHLFFKGNCYSFELSRSGQSQVEIVWLEVLHVSAH